MPLVGIWVKGVRDVVDPVVYCSCLRYRFSSGFPDRATQQQQSLEGACGGSFLMLLFPNGGSEAAQSAEDQH